MKTLIYLGGIGVLLSNPAIEWSLGRGDNECDKTEKILAACDIWGISWDMKIFVPYIWDIADRIGILLWIFWPKRNNQ